MESKVIPQCNRGGVGSPKNGAQVREAQRILAAWSSESQCSGLPVPLRIQAVILSTVKLLLQPFAPAKSNLLQTQPAMAFQSTAVFSVLAKQSLQVK